MSVPPGVDRHPVEHRIASALLQVVDDPSVADVARLDVVVERIEGLGQGVDVIHDPGHDYHQNGCKLLSRPIL